MKLRVYQEKGSKFNNLLSDILHCIKYDVSMDKHYWVSDCEYGLNSVEELSEEEFINLCILATFTDVAYERKGLRPILWSRSPILTLKEPYMDKYVRPLDFFTAHQSEFDHNVFFVCTTYDAL